MGRYAGKQLFAKQFVNDLEKQQLTEIVSAGEDAVRQISDCGWIFILPAIADYVGPTHRFDDLWASSRLSIAHSSPITICQPVVLKTTPCKFDN